MLLSSAAVLTLDAKYQPKECAVVEIALPGLANNDHIQRRDHVKALIAGACRHEKIFRDLGADAVLTDGCRIRLGTASYAAKPSNEPPLIFNYGSRSTI